MKHIFLFVCIVLFAACSKKDDTTLQLPPITNAGLNVIGFKLNGDVVVMSGDSRSILGNGNTYFSGSGRDTLVNFGGTVISPKQYEIAIGFKSNFKLGTYSIAGTYPYRGVFSDFSNGTTLPTGDNQYYTDSAHLGTVTILYYKNQILSGTFSFDAVNGHGTVAHITEGRFDITR